MKRRTIPVVLAFALLGATAGEASAVRYVALGDSYSSGTGTRTYYDSGCQKSVYAYPYLVRNAHPSWTFVHAACGGAKTGDVINTQSASLNSATNWVTYTIGGNDAGFSSVITECAQPWWSSNCNAAIDQAQAYITNTLPGRHDTPQPDGGHAARQDQGSGDPGGYELRVQGRDPAVHWPRCL